MNEYSLQLVKYDGADIPSGYLMGEISAALAIKYLKSIGAPESSVDTVKDIEVSKVIYKAVLKAADIQNVNQSLILTNTEGVKYGAGQGRPIPGYIIHSLKVKGKLPEGWTMEYAGNQTADSIKQYLQQKVMFFQVEKNDGSSVIRYGTELPEGATPLAETDFETLYEKLYQNHQNVITANKDIGRNTRQKDMITRLLNTQVDSTFQPTSGEVTFIRGENRNVLTNFVTVMYQLTGNEQIISDTEDFLNADPKTSTLTLNLKELLSNESDYKHADKVYEILSDPTKHYTDAMQEVKALLNPEEGTERSIRRDFSRVREYTGIEATEGLRQFFESIDFLQAVRSGIMVPEDLSALFPKLARELEGIQSQLQNPEADIESLRKDLQSKKDLYTVRPLPSTSIEENIFYLAKKVAKVGTNFHSIKTMRNKSGGKFVSVQSELVTLAGSLKLFIQDKTKEEFVDFCKANLENPESQDYNDAISNLYDLMDGNSNPLDMFAESYTGYAQNLYDSLDKRAKGETSTLAGQLVKFIMDKSAEDRDFEDKYWPKKQEKGSWVNRGVPNLKEYLTNRFRPSVIGTSTTRNDADVTLTMKALIASATYYKARGITNGTAFTRGFDVTSKAFSMLSLGNEFSAIQMTHTMKYPVLQAHVDASGNGDMLLVQPSGDVLTLPIVGNTVRDTPGLSIKEFETLSKAAITEVAGTMTSAGNPQGISSDVAMLATLIAHRPEYARMLKIADTSVSKGMTSENTQKVQKAVSSFMSLHNGVLRAHMSIVTHLVTTGLGGRTGKLAGDKELKDWMGNPKNASSLKALMTGEGYEKIPSKDKTALCRAIEGKEYSKAAFEKVRKVMQGIAEYETYLGAMSNPELLKEIESGTFDLNNPETQAKVLATIKKKGNYITHIGPTTIHNINAYFKDKQGKSIFKLDKMVEAMDFPDDTPASAQKKKEVMKDFVRTMISDQVSTELERRGPSGQKSRYSAGQPSVVFEGTSQIAAIYSLLRDSGPVEDSFTYSYLPKVPAVDGALDSHLYNGIKFTNGGKTYRVGMRNSEESGCFCDSITHITDSSGNVDFMPLEFKMSNNNDLTAHLNSLTDPLKTFDSIFSHTTAGQGEIRVHKTHNFSTIIGDEYEKRASINSLNWYASIESGKRPDEIDTEGVRSHGIRNNP